MDSIEEHNKTFLGDSMKPPIFIDEHGDLDVFETVEKAERKLEAIDVKNNLFTGYDSEGRLLKLSVSETNMRFLFIFKIDLEKVVIKAAETVPTHASELRNLLESFLDSTEITKEWISQASLEELVSRSLEYKTE